MTEEQLLPVLWTLASMTIAVLTILLAGPAQLNRLRSSLTGRFLEQFLRLLYFIGLPYVALLTGSMASIDLGLTGAGGSLLGWSPAEWLRGLSQAFTLGVIVLIPIGLASRQIARAGGPLGTDERTAGTLIVAALFDQIHWAFYRAAPFILLGEVYAAALVGLLLVGVEWLVMLLRSGLQLSPEEAQVWLRRGVLLVTSAVMFVLTRNVWLALGLQLVIELLWKVWLHRLAPRPLERVSASSTTVPDPDVRPLPAQSSQLSTIRDQTTASDPDVRTLHEQP